MSNSYRFGLLERGALSIVLLFLVPVVLLLTLGFVTEHGDPASDFGKAINWGVWLLLITIAVGLWGRPVGYGIERAINHIRGDEE